MIISLQWIDSTISHYAASIFGVLLLGLLPLQGSAELKQETVSLPSQHGLFDVYEQNRRDNIPNYITTDFLLISYSLLRAKNQETFEQSILMPAFIEWLDALGKAIPSDGTAQSIANNELIALLQTLAGMTTPPMSETTKKEWALIQAASAIQPSPMLHRSLDYTLFKPAGRYAESKESQQFFQAYRYASSALFPLLSSKATGLIAAHADTLFLQAQQIASLTRDNSELNAAHTSLSTLLEKRFGQADDLDWAIFNTTDSLNNTTAKNHSTAQTRQALFTEILKTNKPPTVIADIIDITQLEKDRSSADVVTGWRLMPVFSTPVSSAFQQLIFPNTKAYTGPNKQIPVTSGMVNGQKVKAFPTAIEILALLGDTTSMNQLEASSDTAYTDYDAAFEQAKSTLAMATGFARQHLSIVKSISQNSQRQESALAFWTLQRYVDQLYIKQSTTPTGKGLIFAPERKGAKLEPAVEITNMLIALVVSEIEINPDSSWHRFIKILQSLNALQWKQSLGVAFSAEDESLLNGLDTAMLAITGVTDKPLLVAVHTSPSSRERLWEATGLASVVTNEEARGALLLHREFRLPMDKPLDNVAWLEKLTK